MGVGLIGAETNAILSATIIISMVLTPLMVILHDRFATEPGPDTDGLTLPENVEGTILMVGFGRFGQIVSQPLLARGYTISMIDKDAEFIRDAADFGFKVYYGDASRPEILHAAGVATAKAVLIMIDDKEAAVKIAEHLHHEYPLVPVLARAFDRGHAIDLVKAGVNYQVRELLESSFRFSEEVLVALGEDPELAASVVEECRDVDRQRLELEVVGGIYAGRSLVRGNVQPSDLVAARTGRERAARDAAEAAAQAGEAGAPG